MPPYEVVRMKSDRNTLLGLGALIMLLILVSAISFILSSVEGFLAGIFVIFIGFILSFFRDDIKTVLGISKEKPEIPKPAPKEKDPLYEIEKRISKRNTIWELPLIFRKDNPKLVDHYEELIQDVEETRDKAANEMKSET